MWISVLLLVASSFLVAQGQTVAWPKPDKVLGFWPLNNYYKLRDISGRGNDGKVLAGYVNTKAGPFGDPQQSYGAQSGGIFTVRGGNLTLANSSFTISFFLQHSGTTNDGLFQFHGVNKTSGFSFDSVNKLMTKGNFDIWTGTKAKNFDVITDGVWQFVAVRYNLATEMVSIVGRHGVVYSDARFAELTKALANSNDGFTLGKSDRNGNLNLRASMACLMIYSTHLSVEELAQVQDACRLMQASSPCGSPRLAIPAIPATTTTVARQGQFPWMASLEYNSSYTCGATILDSFFLLTSASCFDTSKNPALYTIKVGEYDLLLQESFEKKHTLRAITIHPNYNETSKNSDIAIIELAKEIDFSNPYVNDACLPKYNIPPLTTVEDEFFVTGWGQAGRNDFVSKTTPRYVSGKAGVHETCDGRNSSSWLTFTAKWNAPDHGDEGAALLQEIGTSGHGVAPRLLMRGVYSSVDSACSKYSPRFACTVAYLPWIKEKIACFMPDGKTPAKCPR